MKKYITFISFIVFLFLLYFYFTAKPKKYEIEYIVNDYNIIEKYDKDNEYYEFILNKDDLSFNFVSNVPYSSNRKLIKNVVIQKTKNALCVEPISSNDIFEMICYKDGEFVDKYIAEVENNQDAKKINSVANIDIYNNDHLFMIWNNKGFTSLRDSKEYKFLNKESYDNLLTYQWQKYIIVADYDQTRIFNRIYIYNNETKRIESWELGVDISFDAYFMGAMDRYIYLFDQKNKIQYRLDVSEKKIKVTSDKDGAIFYDNGLTHKSLDSLAFNKLTFVKENKYNFFVSNNKLYLRLYNSDQFIRISDKKIDHIVYTTDDEVYYLVGEKLYSYQITKGEKLLLVNLEWNFTYLNKIFIFD